MFYIWKIYFRRLVTNYFHPRVASHLATTRSISGPHLSSFRLSPYGWFPKYYDSTVKLYICVYYLLIIYIKDIATCRPIIADKILDNYSCYNCNRISCCVSRYKMMSRPINPYPGPNSNISKNSHTFKFPHIHSCSIAHYIRCPGSFWIPNKRSWLMKFKWYTSHQESSHRTD